MNWTFNKDEMDLSRQAIVNFVKKYALTMLVILIVVFFDEITWPLATLLIVLLLYKDMPKAMIWVFNNYKLKKFSAGKGVFAAEFEAQQSSTSSTNDNKSPLPSINGKSLEEVQKYIDDNETEYTKEAVKRINDQLADFKIEDNKKIELLAKDLSIQQAVNKCFNINRALFKSQFNLFNNQLYPDKNITHDELRSYFNNIKDLTPDSYGDWDYFKYIQYPVEIGIVDAKNDAYSLTEFGKTYIKYMRESTNHINELLDL